MRERSIPVDQQLGLLSRHLDTLRPIIDVFKKDGSVDDEHPLSKALEQIAVFRKAVDEAADRLERLTADEACNHVDVTVGFFHKRLRRAVAAQDALKKLSEHIVFNAPYVGTTIMHSYDDKPEVNEALTKLFLTGDLSRLGMSALERSIMLQVPTVVAIHEAVLAGLVSSIALGMSKLRQNADSTREAA